MGLIFPFLEAQLCTNGAELVGLELLELHAMGALSGHRWMVFVKQGRGGL